MTQKAYAEGLRACTCMPPRIRTTMSPCSFGADPSMAHRVDDLLLPVSRVWLRTRLRNPNRVTADLRGSGFLQDYPIEQYIRDAKSTRSTRPTTYAIPALDLFIPQDRSRSRRALAHRGGPDQQRPSEHLRRGASTAADQVRTALETSSDDATLTAT